MKANHRTLRHVLTLATVLAGTAALAQNTTHPATPPTSQQPMPHMMHPMPGMHPPMEGMSEGSRQLHQGMMAGMNMPMPMTGNVDTDFASMMTMHDRRAIDMADVEMRHGMNAKLRALAKKMKADRQKEIRQLAPYAASTSR